MTPYDQQFRVAFDHARVLFMQGGADASTAARQGMAMIYGAVQRQAALLSFVEVFHLMGILFLACTLLVLLMRTAKAPRIAHVEKHRIQLQPRLRADTATTPRRL